MKIKEHFHQDNPHHAYLIEGEREKVLPEILDILKDLQIETSGNPDLLQITVDSFKIDDARELKSLATEKGLGPAKKIFILSVNNFLLEAQNAMLKMFEEPAEGVLFFIITPDAGMLLPTLVSRFYLIKKKKENVGQETERFINLGLAERIEFLKELLAEEEQARSRALFFLNTLEQTLHQKGVSEATHDTFEQIFKAREFLRQPGSSAKNLLESVALSVPKF